MIIRNAVFYPKQINENEINKTFDDIDELYLKEHKKFYQDQK